MRRRAFGAIATIGVSFAASGCGLLGGGAEYNITLVPPLAGGSMYHGMAAINDNGTVVGASMTADQAIHAFRYQDGTTSDLGGEGAGESLAMGINNNNVVVGTYGGNAVVWDPRGHMTTISGANGFHGSWAYDINDNGVVVGQAAGAPGTRAFRWWNGSFKVLAVPTGCSAAHATTVNSDGTVAGVGVDSFRRLEAVLWSQNGIVDVAHDVPSLVSEAESINSSGSVAGDLGSGSNDQHAFLWENGQIQVLKNLPGCSVMKATSVNDKDVVVGDAANDADPAAPFVWDKTHGTRSLGDLIPRNAGWFLTKAFGINNHGQILCFGQHGATRDQICILTPIGSSS
jgi:probable HAF family extracellular repeat protein